MIYGISCIGDCKSEQSFGFLVRHFLEIFGRQLLRGWDLTSSADHKLCIIGYGFIPVELLPAVWTVLYRTNITSCF